MFSRHSVPLCACVHLTTRLLSTIGQVAATLAVGHRLRGKRGSYKGLEQFAVYEGSRCFESHEREILEIVQNHTRIRQGVDAARFSRVALGDCGAGDVYQSNPNAGPLEENHVISAAILPPTDIWSLGATVLS